VGKLNIFVALENLLLKTCMMPIDIWWRQR
jgi:hypothetical protein